MNIYPPSEDTYFLSDYVKDFSNLQVLEIGCGNGFVTIVLAQNNESVIATDIDINSVNATQALLKSKKLTNVELIVSDSASAVKSSIFDLVVFNPPYLPNSSIDDKNLDGGTTGVELTKEWLDVSHRTLKNNGIVVFVASSLSKIDEIFTSSLFNFDIKRRKHLFFEDLLIIQGIKI